MDEKRFGIVPYFTALVVIGLFLFSACGGGSDLSGGTPADNGTLRLAFNWDDSLTLPQVSNDASSSGDVCVDYEIDTIRAKVFDSSGVELDVQDWACSDHQGVISGLPTDFVLRLLVEGYVSGSADWRGEVSGISFSDSSEYTAEVTMIYVGSDSTPPTIDSAEPAGNEVDVAVDSAIRVTFSEKMVPASLNSSTFTLETDSGLVNGTVTYDVSTRSATFTPDSPLNYNANYSVMITEGAVDLAENRVASAATWSFSTAKIAWLDIDNTIVKFSTAQKELVRIERVNCENLSGITQFAVAPNDNSLWISDTNYDRTMKLDDAGQPLFIIDQWSAIGIVVDPRDGSAWSSKLYQNPDFNRTLINISPLGNILRETAGGLRMSGNDNAMAWNTSDHSIWYANYETDIVKLMNTGNLHGYNASGPSGSNHLRINASGQTFEVSAFNGRAGSPNAPCVWAVNRSGGNLIKYSTDGSELLRINPSGISDVLYVSADRTDGSVWIGGLGVPSRVAKYAYDGSIMVQPVAIDEYLDTIEADPLDGGVWVGARESLIRMDAQGIELWRYTGRVQSIAFALYPARRRIIHVETSGDDSSGNGSPVEPYLTIGKALQEAVEGDSIHVGSGTYAEDIILKSNIAIFGSGTNSTTVQGSGTKHVIEGISVVNVTLSGLNVTGGGDNLSGLYCDDCMNLIIRGNYFHDNGGTGSYSISAGVHVNGSSTAILEMNRISANAAMGILISGDSAVIIRNNLITDNTDRGITRGYGNLLSYILNNVIDSNGNHDFGWSGIMMSSNDVITNNIITNNGGDNPNQGQSVGIWVSPYPTSPIQPNISYNNVWGNYQGSYYNTSAGTGDISANPQFEDPASGDYHLKLDSQSINSGHQDLYDPDCTRSDQGAYGGPFGNW
jgi:parallel beta-helix repeat protein